MAEQQLTNPQGFHRTVTDFRTFKDVQGEDISYGKTTRFFRANEAITKGQVVTFVAATATVPLSVEPAAAGSSFKGVADASAAAGAMVPVVVEGVAEVIALTANAVAFNDAMIVSGTAGTATPVAEDATTVVGTVLGYALNTKASATAGNVFVYVRNV